MHLSKAQLDRINRDMRDELQKTGEPEIEAAKEQAFTKFMRTPIGKRLAKLRVDWGKEKLGDAEVKRVCELATKHIKKPFPYISDYNMEKVVPRASVDATTSAELPTAVLKHYYGTLKPAVRKQFKLKLA